MGLRLEYFVSDLIGLGVDVNYKSIELTDDYLSGTNTYTQTISSKQLRVMARLNFHFVRTEMVDFYAGTGVGYKSNSWEFSDTNPNSIDTEFDALIPVAFRMSTGVRVFFTENIGANVELGLAGGSFATAGLTFKL
jgi:opacity protein-like surface antigen